VSDGVVQCCVGRLAPEYQQVLDHLDGRIGQVTTKFSDSTSSNKIRQNSAKNGLCLVTLVDRHLPGDGALNDLLGFIEIDSSSDEN
jgi:hypothetical protein